MSTNRIGWRPAVFHRTTHPTTTYDCAISSVSHGSPVEHEAKRGERPTLSKQRRSTWWPYRTRNQTSGSNIEPSISPIPVPSTSKNREPNGTCTSIFKGTHLTTFLRNPDNAARDSIQSATGTEHDKRPESSEHAVKSSATDENGSNQKSTCSMTKLATNLVEESADAFPPLNSLVRSLSAILNHCDVRSIFLMASPVTLTVVLADGGVSRNDRIIDTSS